MALSVVQPAHPEGRSEASSVVEPSTRSENKMSGWIDRLEKFQGYIVILLGFALPISISFGWGVLILGLIIWTICETMRFAEKRSRHSSDTKAEKTLESKFQKDLLRSAKPSLFSRLSRDVAPLAFPILVFVAAMFVCGLPINGLKAGVYAVGTLKTLLVYPFVHQALRRAQWAVPHAILAVLATSAVSSVYAACQQIFDWHPIQPNGFKYLQGTGFMTAPMPFAGQMQVVISFAASLLLYRGFENFPAPLNKKQVAILFAVLSVVGLIFAAERSAWVGAICAIIALTLSFSFKTFMKGFLAMAIVGALTYAFVPIVKQRIDPMFNPNQDPSITARYKIWNVAFEKFKENPVYGIGIRRFPHISGIEGAVNTKGYFDHAHSNYLHLLATTGLIGFIAYIYLIFATLRLSWKILKLKERDGAGLDELRQLKLQRSIAAGSLAATTALMISGIFEYNFGTGQVRLFYFYMLAFLGLPFRYPLTRESSTTLSTDTARQSSSP